MMAKKLSYFDINGIAESIRYILHYTKQEFEDFRHDMASWPNPEVKNALPYGQFPLYQEGDKTLNQSLAIAKYVARGTDLIPTDPWKQAVLESVVYNIYDFWSNGLKYIREQDPEKKEAIKKQVLEETIDYYFSRFEKHLKENGGFFSGKLSWAEFILIGIVETTNLVFDIELEANYPAVAAVIQTIRNLPRVKEYIAKRKPYKF